MDGAIRRTQGPGLTLADNMRLLSIADVAELTGLSRECATAFVKAHGIQIPGRRRWFITMPQLMRGLGYQVDEMIGEEKS